MGSFDVPLDGERVQLEAFIEEHRGAIEAALDGLTEEQARRRLVPSATTVLGLLKHVTWMQRVWFEECVGGRSRAELGLVASPDDSFRLGEGDTVASVTAAHREACATAREVVAELPLDTVVTGHRTGPRTLRWVYLQVLRELAQHCGHADILREQILAARPVPQARTEGDVPGM
ncbi:DinB family protein [Amycolatopsis solani]|uniref:DinB family protein n=1 Tax=Amycolatopsis solani TaxID=3028615 RepID=UPI0025B22FDC|nr:DinB family protein [Amycolatopsis sp. MEP2-6]